MDQKKLINLLLITLLFTKIVLCVFRNYNPLKKADNQIVNLKNVDSKEKRKKIALLEIAFFIISAPLIFIFMNFMAVWLKKTTFYYAMAVDYYKLLLFEIFVFILFVYSLYNLCRLLLNLLLKKADNQNIKSKSSREIKDKIIRYLVIIIFSIISFMLTFYVLKIFKILSASKIFYYYFYWTNFCVSLFTVCLLFILLIQIYFKRIYI